MTVIRKWFCTCSGSPVELEFVESLEDEPGEAICRRCGASPSSDPRRTIIYKDKEEWHD